MKTHSEISRVLFFCLASALLCISPATGQNKRAEGYRGIWFTLGQKSEYGDKYSGGLGTYTAYHQPVAIYSPSARKTFFVYGGTTSATERHLLIMISYYDHRTGKVPRPVIVCDKEGVNDPHDDAALSIDGNGFIYVFVSGRARTRPGFVYRSRYPYSIDSFDRVYSGEITYPQPYIIPGNRILLLYTRYTKGRELYFRTIADGKEWGAEQKFAGMGGHYQVSCMKGNRLVTAFNYHPGGDVDKRTNLYFAVTEDFGTTWRNIEGSVLNLPLAETGCEALVRDYAAENCLVYLNDINIDKNGNPVILIVVSRGFRPGPSGDPREWIVVHRKEGKWQFSKVCESTHNYDMGSIYVEDGQWRIVGPTEPGPQKWGTGGEIASWVSNDEGNTWKKYRMLTSGSLRNHSYVRRPLNAQTGFYSFWADGDADKLSESWLWFADREGRKVLKLPYTMDKEFEKPEKK